MKNLPEIFNFSENTNGNSPLTLPENEKQWGEFLAHLSQYSSENLPQTLAQLETAFKDESNPSLQGVLLAGIGRCIIRQGNFTEGAQTLGRAYNMVPEEDGDARAFVLLEMIAFLAIIGNFDTAIMIVEKIPNLTQSDYLLRLANYYGIVQDIRKGKREAVTELEESAKYFNKMKAWPTLAFHYKIIANVARRNKEYKKANSLYQKALKIADKEGYPHITAAIQHDLGMLHYHRGDREDGIRILMETVEGVENQYTRAFILCNVGFLYFSQKEYANALPWFIESLEVINKNGIFHLIPGVCYYIGKIYEANSEMGLAKFHLEKASKAAHELVSRHFPYNGDRLRAIQSYIEFLEKHPPEQDIHSLEFDLSFAIDKTLKQIRGVFQKEMLDLALRRTGNVKAAALSLNMPQRTFYAARERVKEYESIPAPKPVQLFIKQNSGRTWEESNTRFEGRVLDFLKRQYGSKKALSEKLGVSYPYLVKLTKKLEAIALPAPKPVAMLEAR